MKVIQQLNSHATQDGDGVNISRIPGFDGKYLDPFLMIDESEVIRRRNRHSPSCVHPAISCRTHYKVPALSSRYVNRGWRVR